MGCGPRSGAVAVCEVIGLGTAVADAQLVITGEGRYDTQTASGKAVNQIEKLAHDHGVPVAVVAGQITAASATVDSGISLTELAGSVEAAMADPLRWLEVAGRILAERYS
jgi:glycerate kinase